MVEHKEYQELMKMLNDVTSRTPTCQTFSKQTPTSSKMD
jgi:hypothetical protein